MDDCILFQDGDGMGLPQPEDFFHLSDDDLRKATSATREPKLKGIRKWPEKLSDKQRYCLCAWLAKKDAQYV